MTLTDLFQHWPIIPLFALVAMLYSSVGHGGASGYLALLSLFGLASPSSSAVVLVLNILAASIGFIAFRQAGYFSFKKLLPFIVGSVPAAFVGASIKLSPQLFSITLGVALLLAAIRILFLREIKSREKIVSERMLWQWGIPIGVVLGLLSGMVGIGGGVFLSPILLFMRWADVRETAALASAFIVINSLSGLVGHLATETIPLQATLLLSGVVLVGAIIGSQLGALKIRPLRIQTVLGVVLLTASVKLLLK